MTHRVAMTAVVAAADVRRVGGREVRAAITSATSPEQHLATLASGVTTL